MDWRFSSFLLLLLSVLFWFSWATPEHGWCGSKFVTDVLALNSKDGALSCVEFWLNRYQTLLGAVLALIAAWIATIPARGQLKEMSRQSAASARQSRVDIANGLEAEIDIITRLLAVEFDIRAIVSSYENDNPHDNYQTIPHTINAVLKIIVSEQKQLKIIEARSSAGNDIAYVRQEAISLTTDFIDALNMLWRANFARIGQDEEYSVSPSADEIAKAPANLWDTLFLWKETVQKLHEVLEGKKREAWGEVRALESRALN